MEVKLLFLVALLHLVSNSYASVSLTVNGLAATLKNDYVELNFNAQATISTAKVLGTNLAASGVKTFYLDWNSGKNYFFVSILNFYSTVGIVCELSKKQQSN